MKKVLYLNGSLSGLTDLFAKKEIENDFEKGTYDLTIIDLNKELDQQMQTGVNPWGFYHDSEKYISWFRDFDFVYISSGMYNFKASMVFLSLLDKITVANKTFSYTSKDPQIGLLPKGKIKVVVSSGSSHESLKKQKAEPFHAIRGCFNFINVKDEAIEVKYFDGTNEPEIYDLSKDEKYEVINKRAIKC